MVDAKTFLTREDSTCKACGRSVVDWGTGAHDNCADALYDVLLYSDLNPDGTYED